MFALKLQLRFLVRLYVVQVRDFILFLLAFVVVVSGIA